MYTTDGCHIGKIYHTTLGKPRDDTNCHNH